MLSDFKTFIAFRKSPLVPFLYAMLLVFGFHVTHIANIFDAKNKGTFYEQTFTKVSQPSLSFQDHHLYDLPGFEKEEKEENSESESNVYFTIESEKNPATMGFFLISGAAGASVKIPSIEGKEPLYILFKNLKVHLA